MQNETDDMTRLWFIRCVILTHCAVSYAFHHTQFRAFAQKQARTKVRRSTFLATATTNSDVMQRIKSHIVVENNVPETIRNLIRYGDQWSLEPREIVESTGTHIANCNFEKVSGCTSTVQIKTHIVPENKDIIDTDFLEQEQCRVQVEGSADSRVTQGMLAILCQVNLSIVQ